MRLDSVRQLLRERRPINVGDTLVVPRKVLGTGGNSIVLEVENISRSTPSRQKQPHLMALKLLKPIASGERRRKLDRFVLEIASLKRIDSESVTKIYDVGELQLSGNTIKCYLMELGACTLRELVQRLWLPRRKLPGGPDELGDRSTFVPPKSILADITLQIVQGLQSIHKAGLVHRDLKPENIILRNDWSAFICDLGLVLNVNAVRLTVTNERVANRDYWAPEQRSNSDLVDHRADYFSLAMVLVELLTGHLPRGAWESDIDIGSVIKQWGILESLTAMLSLDLKERTGQLAELEKAMLHISSKCLEEDLRDTRLMPKAPTRFPITTKTYDESHRRYLAAREALKHAKLSRFGESLLKQLYNENILFENFYSAVNQRFRTGTLRKLAIRFDETDDYQRYLEELIKHEIISTFEQEMNGDIQNVWLQMTLEGKRLWEAEYLGLAVDDLYLQPTDTLPSVN